MFQSKLSFSNTVLSDYQCYHIHENLFVPNHLKFIGQKIQNTTLCLDET